MGKVGLHSYSDLVDVILTYGAAGGSSARARQLYAKRFPDRIPVGTRTFATMYTRLRETGRFEPCYINKGCSERKRTRKIEDELLEKVEEDPCVSSRMLAQNMGISVATVIKLLRENQLNCYYLRSGAMLNIQVSKCRLQFSKWLLENYSSNEHFLRNILVCGEVQFNLKGIESFENTAVWSTKKENAINLWAGIVNGILIGPFTLPNPMSLVDYWVFLQEMLPQLLDEIPLSVREKMWFLHDEISLHCVATVQEYLKEIFKECVIAPGARIMWPERSSDLHPLDFFFWSYMKQLVYNDNISDVNQLSDKIKSAADKISQENVERCYSQWIRRAKLCVRVEGGNFEYLL